MSNNIHPSHIATPNTESHGHDEDINWNTMDVAGADPSEHSFNSADNSSLAKFASTASWIVNWFLLFAKIYCVIISASKAVSAALADSAVDLVSQAVLSLAESYISKHSPNYPIGRSRLEALSVMTCAFIMTMASVEVIQYSIVDLYEGLTGNIPELEIGTVVYILLGVGIATKIFLFVYCKWANLSLKTDTLEALAEDHLNDVFSNIGAVVTATIAYNVSGAWWIDPLGAILISQIIIYRWISVVMDQVKKIVGHIAPSVFIEQVEELARAHDERLRVDCTRAYHFGARYNVEMEIVLPGLMTVVESHDIALALQHKIEKLEDVERAFVHVDHLVRDGLEHKVERQLAKGNQESTQLLDNQESPLHGDFGLVGDSQAEMRNRTGLKYLELNDFAGK